MRGRAAHLTRIIGGVAGGRRIAVPPRGTRPTTDRVRESLFNIVTARRDLTGLAVLDLYAGSGALGLEALSRGAASVLFVESDQRSAAVIARNIEALGLSGAPLPSGRGGGGGRDGGGRRGRHRGDHDIAPTADRDAAKRCSPFSHLVQHNTTATTDRDKVAPTRVVAAP